MILIELGVPENISMVMGIVMATIIISAPLLYVNYKVAIKYIPENGKKSNVFLLTACNHLVTYFVYVGILYITFFSGIGQKDVPPVIVPQNIVTEKIVSFSIEGKVEDQVGTFVLSRGENTYDYQNLAWTITRDGERVLFVNADNERTYQYDNVRPGYYQGYVSARIDGQYIRVSNIVTFIVPE